MKKLKLLLAMIMVIIGATTGVAQDLYICGNPITTSGSISGIDGVSGSVTYSGTTLTLNNATITAASSQGITMNSGTIVVEGDNTITSSAYNALKIGGSVIIRGTGTLTLIGNGTGSSPIGGCGIYLENTNSSYTLSIIGGVLVKSKGARYGIYGANSNQSLRVTGENTKFIAQGPEGSVYLAGNLQLYSPLQILTPEGASFNQSKKSVVDASGNVVSSEVINAKEGYNSDGDNPEAYAVLSGSTLTFYYDNCQDMHLDTTYPITSYAPDWINNTTITTVDFDASYDNYRPTTAQQLFEGLTNLTAINNISRLHTDNITNMNRMFYGCSNLESLDVSGFNTEKVTGMYWMFRGCSKLTSLDVSGFNTSNVTTMEGMFRSCSQLTELNLLNFVVNYISVNYMFAYCSNLTTIYCNDTWNPSSSTNMFLSATQLYSATSGQSYNSSNVGGTYANPTSGYFTSMKSAYAVANGSTLTFYYDMQKNSRTGTKYNVPWSNANKPGWYENAAAITTVDFDESFADYGDLTSTFSMFDGMTSLTTINHLERLNTTNVTDMSQMFYGCTALTSLDLSSFDTQNVTSMQSMFGRCSSLTTLDLTNFDTQKVIGMSLMFYECSNLVTIYSNDDWNTGIVTSSSDMFTGCTNLKGGNRTGYDANNVTVGYAHPDASGNPGYFTAKREPYALVSEDGKTLTFYYDTRRKTRTGTKYDMTWDVYPGWTNSSGNSTITTAEFAASFADYHELTNIGNMFYKMTALEQIYGLGYLNTENVTNMSYMFFDCSSLFWLDVFYFNTEKVTSMSQMFYNCSALTSLDLSSFNTENVERMMSMFFGCTSLTTLDLTSFNTKKVNDMRFMFYDCSNLETIYSNDDWNTTTVTNSGDMFTGCTNLKGGNGTVYDASNTTVSYAHPDASGNPGYFTAKCEPYAVVSEDGKTLTFYYDTQRKTRNGTVYNMPWAGYSYYPGWISEDEGNSTITTVDFDESFADYGDLTSTRGMFHEMTALTAINNLNRLNTENVTNMGFMFDGCTALISLDLTSFNTSNVIRMDKMFSGCTNLKTIYNDDDWNTTTVTNSDNMFYGCTNLKGSNGTVYDASNITVGYAHPDASGNPGYFTAKPGPYAVLSTDGTTLTFYYDNNRASHTEGAVHSMNTANNNPGWYANGSDVTSVVFDASFADARPTSTYNWFGGMTNLTSITDMKYLNTSEVTNMSGMFSSCSSLTSIDVSGFNTAKVTTMSYMFSECLNLVTIYASAGTDWSTSTTLSNSNNMFYNCSKLVGGNDTEHSSSHVDAEYARIDGGPDSDTPGYFTEAPVRAYAVADGETLTFYYDNQISSRTGTFYYLPWTGTYPGWTSEDEGNSTITTVDFDQSFATYRDLPTTQGMFYKMTALTTINNLYRLNTEKVTSMRHMFYQCRNLTDITFTKPGVLSSPIGAKATDMSYMFTGCSSLTSLNLSSFDTRNVTDMSYMFAGSALTSLYLNGFNTEKVTNMGSMFQGCSSLTNLDLSTFNTGEVTDMSMMFLSCSSLTNLDLSTFNTEKVTNMYWMFRNSPALTTIYVGSKWMTAAVTSSGNMFLGCTSLVGGKGTAYATEGVTDAEYARIDDPDNGKPGYFTYKASMLLGDVNNDGSVDIADVTALSNIILGKTSEGMGYNLEAADMDGSGSITIVDAKELVNTILRGSE